MERRRTNFTRDLTIVIPALLGVALSSSAQEQAARGNPSTAKIIDAWLHAEGGSKRVMQLRSVEYHGTVTDTATKESGHFTLILEQPNRLYQEIAAGRETLRLAYNGKSAWREDRDGLRTLTGTDASFIGEHRPISE